MLKQAASSPVFEPGIGVKSTANECVLFDRLPRPVRSRESLLLLWELYMKVAK